MSKKFFDFDKLFEEYMRAKFMGKKGVDLELIKSQMGRLYNEWSQTPLSILGGEAPKDYFNDINEPAKLIDFLISSCENDKRPNSFLLDRISEVGDTAPLLRNLIAQNINSTLTLTTIELLENMNAPHPLEDYVDMLRDESIDSELREIIIEVLTENADSIRESLYNLLLDSPNTSLKIIIAEVLINARRDERTTSLLSELFNEADNIPLIASYIGRYGDESLIRMLYKSLDTCNYMEFLEVKNAIERMGGAVDDSYDFSEDVYYRIIKDGSKPQPS